MYRCSINMQIVKSWIVKERRPQTNATLEPRKFNQRHSVKSNKYGNKFVRNARNIYTLIFDFTSLAELTAVSESEESASVEEEPLPDLWRILIFCCLSFKVGDDLPFLDFYEISRLNILM